MIINVIDTPFTPDMILIAVPEIFTGKVIVYIRPVKIYRRKFYETLKVNPYILSGNFIIITVDEDIFDSFIDTVCKESTDLLRKVIAGILILDPCCSVNAGRNAL